MEAAVARAPATCGELFQGMLGNQLVLVSCPIDWWVEATATGAETLTVEPKGKTKVETAVGRLLAAHGVEAGVSVQIRSDVPAGRGLGSSTADIGAALGAVSALLDLPSSPLTLTRAAAEVEPTDSSLLDGLAVLDHRAGRLVIPLPPPPPMDILVVDPGGFVDTVAFNSVDRTAGWRSVAAESRASAEQLVAGLREGNALLVAEAATRSTRASQQVVPNAVAERLLELLPRTGGMGVVSARSGTVAGLLLPAGAATPERARWLQQQLGDVEVRCSRVVPGGVRSARLYAGDGPPATASSGCAAGVATEQS